jgi:hypothetical protein
MIHALITIAESFAGSFIAVMVVLTMHLDDLYAEHHERVEDRRAKRRYAKGLKKENDERIKNGYRPHPEHWPPDDPADLGVGPSDFS